ncbi:hypothetical protein [Haloferax volcanii]|uniref:DUF8135 domain-containing protein n=3 Tax=Haloferax volcanii TaxID=2246 RepID=A0A384LG49_HALVD|nr:hypothetical protein [Haloferax volcanii]ADE02669.1 uncharacterized protein HVO_2631 [Haloferax volcanii DS2]ELY32539.1 hypothetical protein C498_08440 [Haloferax volcanii DS2]MBS8118391.1 hypothetical protein [Haloferax volcanii]MBS8123404.1 hypothetical protein [Haloferax volcanii]MBS8127272.1 hypothetical protein [Haloferax volcanii]
MTDDNSTDDAAEGEPSVSGDRDDSFGRADPGDDSAEAVRAPDGSRDGRSDDADSAPLSDLAGRVAERRARSRVTDQRDETDELFESVEIGELDRDDVWTSLVEGGDDVEAEGVGVGAEATPVDDGEGVADHVVPKSEFCQRCEHFAAPPELACHHEGTTIVGLEDSDHFRVRNCPMVEKDD